MTIHSPERQSGETQKDYRERMAKAKSVAFMVRAIDPRTLGKGPSSTDRERAAAKARRPAAPGPKFAPQRVRKQHKHPLHDAHGAYVCVGAVYEVEGMAPDTNREHVTSSWVDGDDMGYTARRKWLAGISAQRGY